MYLVEANVASRYDPAGVALGCQRRRRRGATRGPGNPTRIVRTQEAELSLQAPQDAAPMPTRDELGAVAGELECVIATAPATQTKALLRILIAGLRVNGKDDIRPTYRVTIPDGDAPFWPGFAHSQEKWRRRESNPRPQSREKAASTSVAGALISSPARLAGGVAGDQLPEVSPVRQERTSPGEPAI
jgi:hypothetical protein